LPCKVFVLGGALHAKDAQLVVKLRKAAHRHSGMIALLDPDPAGRQGRQALHEKFGPACLHAFVPGVFAHATTITR
jgi:5S rRNA maturation endonuclease (ribonuclease M5)